LDAKEHDEQQRESDDEALRLWRVPRTDDSAVLCKCDDESKTLPIFPMGRFHTWSARSREMMDPRRKLVPTQSMRTRRSRTESSCFFSVGLRNRNAITSATPPMGTFCKDRVS
jgi:hypothetical protein